MFEGGEIGQDHVVEGEAPVAVGWEILEHHHRRVETVSEGIGGAAAFRQVGDDEFDRLDFGGSEGGFEFAEAGGVGAAEGGDDAEAEPGAEIALASAGDDGFAGPAELVQALGGLLRELFHALFDLGEAEVGLGLSEEAEVDQLIGELLARAPVTVGVAHSTGQGDFGDPWAAGAERCDSRVERALEIETEQGDTVSEFLNLAGSKIEVAGAGAGFGEAEDV